MNGAATAKIRPGSARQWTRAAAVACVLLAGVLSQRIPVHVQAAAGSGVLTHPLTHATGLPPHQQWALPNDALREWVPFALDGPTVLMIWNTGFNPSKQNLSLSPQPLRFALAHAGSPTLTPIPAGAYPHSGVAGRWGIEMPWIVGVVWTTAGGPRHWELWAGNVQTGASLILDHANPGDGPSLRTPPDFSLDGGRVAWNYQSRATPSGLEHSKIAIYDLARHALSFVAPSPTQDDVGYEQISLSGDTVVWVRVTPALNPKEHQVLDLLRFDLRTHTLTNLTRNWQKPGTDGSGISDEPSLRGQLLTFKQAPSPMSTGDVILWDLRGTQYPLWDDKSLSQLLDQDGEAPMLGDGIAIWLAQYMATSALLDEQCGRVWTLQDPKFLGKQAYPYTWQLQWLSGRYIIAQRSNAQNLIPDFFVWYIPPGRCS